MHQTGFHRIALMGREGTEGVPETLMALIDYLQAQKKQVVLEETAAHLIKNPHLPIVTPTDLKKQADLLIVVGGDGSLLNAAHLAVVQQLPVLGINRGRLGFLTDIHPDHLPKIAGILQGDYQEEYRFLLDARIQSDHDPLTQESALNDVVLLPGDIAHMIEFDIYINEAFVCSQRADGLIVATPTGSTAYALSGGGPILHPNLDAIVIVPMFPHTLSSRPIVVQGDSQIKMVIAKTNSVSPYVSCDGQTRVARFSQSNLRRKVS